MRLVLKGLGNVGWLPDQSSFELPPNAITDLQNFRMRNGWAERVHGYRQAFTDTASVPYYLAPFATATNRFIVHATAGALYADVTAGRSTITPATGLANVTINAWTSAVMNGVLTLCNGTTAPMYWTGDTSAVAATLPGWNATWSADAIASIKFHWVALGMTEGGASYPHRVRISAKCLPGSPGTTWDATDPTNDADYFDVGGDGGLVWALPMGPNLVIYKSNSMAMLSYIGGEEVWGLQPLTIPHGMLAVNCGVNVPGIGHVVLTRDDVIAHDGTTSRSILDAKAKDYLIANMDGTYFAASYVVADFAKSEVQICFPATGNSVATKSILWNWRTETLGYRDLPNTTCGCTASFDYATETFDNDTVTFDSESAITFDTTSEMFAANESRVLMASTNNKIYIMDSTDTADGAAFTGYIELGGLANLEPKLHGRQLLLSDVWLDIDAAVGTAISVYYGASQDPKTAFTYNAPVTFTVGTSRKADDFVCGPYPAIKLSSAGWFRVRTIGFEVSDEGEF